jgi:hypothetical protein
MTKTVAEKLFIKPGSAVWTSSHPELVDPLPAGAKHVGKFTDAATAVLFAADSAALRQLLDEHQRHLDKPTLLWIAYPKGNKADINRDTLWPIVGEYGMRPVSQVAVDEKWSALRFRSLAEGEAPFTGGR